MQLTEKETSWKRHIVVSWNALYNRLSVGLYIFPVLCFARTDRNKIVKYILDLYTSHKVPNTILNPVAKNLLRRFVRFPPTCHSRANPTDFTTAVSRPCATLFHGRYALQCSGSLSLKVWLSLSYSTISVRDIPVRWHSRVFVSLFYKRPNAVHDEGQGGRRIACPPHISCSMHIHLPVFWLEISLTSVQAGTVRNSVMRPQNVGKMWASRRNVCGRIRGRDRRTSWRGVLGALVETVVAGVGAITPWATALLTDE